MFKLYLAQFLAVWNFFSPFKLKTRQLAPDELPMLRCLTPLFGLAIALPALIPVLVVRHFFLQAWVAAVLAVFSAIVMDYLAGWNNFRILVEYVENRKRGVPQDSALLGPIDGNGRSLPLNRARLIILYIVRILLLWVAIACGNAYYIVIVTTADYLVRAEMATIRNEKSEEFIPAPKRFASMHWHLGFLVILLAAFSHSALAIWGGALACVLAWGIATYADNLVAETPYGTSKYSMSVFGYATEYILLIVAAMV